ncbi:MAG: Wzz/FepE/Etk N-terminal domain-containing protein [Gammaproteobacteria bacterium]|tara:strand:- start:221 stop:1201 length:981 start_codon:yes stop_codon:yes gene_type:complete
MNEKHMNDIDNLSFSDIFGFFWKKRKLIVKITGTFTLLFIAISLLIPNTYTSSSLLLVAQQKTQQNNMSGLSALTGFSSGALQSSLIKRDADFSIAVLESRDFVEHIISKGDFLPALMATKSFDHETGEIIFDDNLYLVESKKWIRKKVPVPTILETHKVYLRHLNVSYDKLTGHISISFEHLSPIFAYEFLSTVIKELNDIARNSDFNDAKKSLIFLNEQARTNTVAQVNDTISNLMEEQLNKQMIANVSEDYLLKVIDKPFIPEKKSSPRRTYIAIFGVIFGLFISIFWIIFYNIVPNNYKQKIDKYLSFFQFKKISQFNPFKN